MSSVGPNIAELEMLLGIQSVDAMASMSMVGSNIAELELLLGIRSDAMAMRLLSSVGLCVFSRGSGAQKDMRLLSSVGLCVFSRGSGAQKG